MSDQTQPTTLEAKLRELCAEHGLESPAGTGAWVYAIEFAHAAAQLGADDALERAAQAFEKEDDYYGHSYAAHLRSLKSNAGGR